MRHTVPVLVNSQNTKTRSDGPKRNSDNPHQSFKQALFDKPPMSLILTAWMVSAVMGWLLTILENHGY